MTLTRTAFTRKRKPTTDAYAAALDLITPQLMEAADYRCQLRHPSVCGDLTDRAWVLVRHHRKRRTQGGQSTMANVRILCEPCHREIHDNPSESYARGWLVHSWSGPESITFESWRER